jgi:CRISPR-associated endonuclease Csn1
MAKILGIDLGPNSIGWALIDDNKESIVGTGVRIFQEGINRSGGKEESKNATRRAARQARRMNARRKARMRRLVYILQDNDLIPTEQDNLDQFFRIDPYGVRAKGVNKKLSLHELGRALYHINQRRGFKSNRKTDKASDTGVLFTGKDGKSGIDETSQAIKKGGFKTLGEYLNSLNPHEKRQRNRYTLRAMYIHEFNTLIDKQSSYYSDLFTDELKSDLFDAIFYQRKLKSQKHTVAHCTFEPKKKVTPKSSPIFQEFRIWQQIANIKVSYDERENTPLTDDEREKVADALMFKESMTFDQLRKLLSFPKDAHINLQSLEKLKGNTTFTKLGRVFGKKEFAAFSNDDQWHIWHTLHFYDDPIENENWLADHFKVKWDLNDEQIEKLHKVSLEAAYGSLSHKAISKILPHLKISSTDDGLPMTFDKAVQAAGYDHHSQVQTYDGTLSRLPLPDDLRNPIVQQSLFEVRHVVNTIIDEHGKPDIVRVELARDTKNPKWKRNGLLKLNKKRERERDEVKAILVESGIHQPSGEDLIKYRLWQECNETCPFTGKKISFTALFSESSNEFQIEHIIPYSRSLDDSQANKTLCYWKTNQEKHNKTPHEAFGSNEKLWEEILDRVSKFHPSVSIARVSPEAGKVVSKWGNKLRKFKIKNIDDKLSEEFISRQLNDTAYISKEVSKFLSYISPKVYVTSGRATSTLRYHWGLNEILSGNIDHKQREDHRHHAVDALVVANTSHSFVQTMSRFHKYDREPKGDRFPLPWKNFWTDTKEAVNEILVSHRIKDRARGKLHEETNYGRITLPEGEQSYVVRKPLESLTPKQITQIVDPVTRMLILSHLKGLGVNTDEKFTIPKEAWEADLHLPNNPHPIRKVRVAVPTKRMLRLYDDKKQFVEYGKNHHMEIFENGDGNREFRIVSMYDAVQRKKSGQSIVNTTPDNEGSSFLISLGINELVLLDVEEKHIDWNNPPSSKDLGTTLYRVQKMDVNGYIHFCHHTVSVADYDTGKVAKTFSSFFGIKVVCNELGNIRPI